MAGKVLVIKREPAFIDNEQGRPAVETVSDAMEEIGKHRGCGASANQSFGLESLNRCFAKTLEFRIQQSAVGPAQAIRLQAPLQRVRLEQHRQACQGALLDRRRSQRRQRGPQMVLCLRRDLDLFPRQDRSDPFRRPAPLGGIVDPGQWLQRNWLGRIVRQRSTQVMPVATHSDGGRPD